MLTEQVTVTIPVGRDCFLAARAVETPETDAVVRDDVEVAVVSAPCDGWIVLVSIRFEDDRPVVDPAVRRPLGLDRVVVA
jgi:hypothetical protein